MATKEDKIILKKNGQIVMEALHEIGEPATLVNLAKQIAQTYDSDEKTVREPLKKFLDTGIDLGVITCTRGKYYLYGDVAGENEKSDDEVGDAIGRRRRSPRRRSSKRRPAKKTTGEAMPAMKRSRKRASRSRSKKRAASRRRNTRRTMSE